MTHTVHTSTRPIFISAIYYVDTMYTPMTILRNSDNVIIMCSTVKTDAVNETRYWMTAGAETSSLRQTTTMYSCSPTLA